MRGIRFILICQLHYNYMAIKYFRKISTVESFYHDLYIVVVKNVISNDLLLYTVQHFKIKKCNKNECMYNRLFLTNESLIATVSCGFILVEIWLSGVFACKQELRGLIH